MRRSLALAALFTSTSLAFCAALVLPANAQAGSEGDQPDADAKSSHDSDPLDRVDTDAFPTATQPEEPAVQPVDAPELTCGRLAAAQEEQSQKRIPFASSGCTCSLEDPKLGGSLALGFATLALLGLLRRPRIR